MSHLVVITGSLWARYQGRKFLETVAAPDSIFDDAKIQLDSLEHYRKEGSGAEHPDASSEAQ